MKLQSKCALLYKGFFKKKKKKRDLGLKSLINQQTEN